MKIPQRLGSIARVADERDSTRYLLKSVYVESSGGKTSISATDSKIMIRVMLDGDLNGTAAIDAATWAHAFDCVGPTESLEVELKNKTVQFLLPGGAKTTAPIKEGRYPPVDEILNAATKPSPVHSIRVDARKLGQLLLVLAELAGPEHCNVSIEKVDDARPVVVRVEKSEWPIAAVIMPLAPESLAGVSLPANGKPGAM